jgi:hypothetical protein
VSLVGAGAGSARNTAKVSWKRRRPRRDEVTQQPRTRDVYNTLESEQPHESRDRFGDEVGSSSSIRKPSKGKDLARQPTPPSK